MLLKAPGAKLSAAARDLLPLLPSSFAEYREPMCFGAGLYWQIDPRIPRWLGDMNPSVIDFYRWFRDDPSAVNYLLGLKKQLPAARDIYNHFLWCRYDYWKTGNPRAYWFLNRYAWYRIVLRTRNNVCSFDPRNVSHGGIRGLKRDALKRAKAYLATTKLTQGDFQAVVDAPGKDVAIYIDPPYRNSQKKHKLYDFCLSDEDWLRLAWTMRNSPHKIMLTVGKERRMKQLFCRPPFNWKIRRYHGWYMSSGEGNGRWHYDYVVRNYS